MSTGPAAATPKPGGSIITLALGTAFFAGIVGTFYFSRFRAHRNDDQTWITRHGQQPGTALHASASTRLVTTDKGVEPVNNTASIPLPGNNDNRGSESVGGRLMSVVANRGVDPDGKVPEDPGNMQQPAPQRRNSDGSHYTKAGYYAESYKQRPQDPDAPKEGRS